MYRWRHCGTSSRGLQVLPVPLSLCEDRALAWLDIRPCSFQDVSACSCSLMELKHGVRTSIKMEAHTGRCSWTRAQLKPCTPRTMKSQSVTACADSGEWAGWEKSGVGIYQYPSKASYAGQWSNNLKSGYGIYRFPAGGIYKVGIHSWQHGENTAFSEQLTAWCCQGQWLLGAMDGLGIRVFSSGRVNGGLWRAGRLVEHLPLPRCAATVKAATQAATAASAYEVSPASLRNERSLLSLQFLNMLQQRRHMVIVRQCYRERCCCSRLSG